MDELGATADLIANRYRPLRPLGAGAGGEVLLALDEITGEDVAVKLLFAGTEADRRVELAALRRVHRPGVARLLDHGRHEGRPLLVMEHVAGPPFPGAPAPLPWEILAPRVRALLLTLSALHADEILHLDLKPAHARVGPDDRVTLLDLGLASGAGVAAGSASGARGGSPRYAAPEQILGRSVDASADLYAVGAMLYEALTGSLPQRAQEGPACAAERVRRDAVPLAVRAPALPEALCAAIDALVARRPDARPRSAWEALSRLGLAPADPLVPAGSLDPASMRGLIEGPAPLLHVPEDAAAELWRRAGDDPGLVRAELATWVRVGLAEARPVGVAMGRDALDRLLAGGGVSRAELPAVPLPGDAADALRVVLARWPWSDWSSVQEELGWPDDRFKAALSVAGEAVRLLPSGLLRPMARPEGALVPRLASPPVARRLAQAWSLHQDGRSREATALIAIALDEARQQGDLEAEGRALGVLARVAIGVGAPRGIRSAHYEALRAAGDTAARREAETVLDAAVRALSGQHEQALALLGSLDVSPALESTRLAVLLLAAERAGDAEDAALAAARAWAERADSAAARA